MSVLPYPPPYCCSLQAPGTRARALRSLGEVVTEAGAAQAGKHAVHAVVEASLTVREAAVCGERLE